MSQMPKLKKVIHLEGDVVLRLLNSVTRYEQRGQSQKEEGKGVPKGQVAYISDFITVCVTAKIVVSEI